MSIDLSPFIADAQRLQDSTGIPASITLGQIMLESSGKYAGGLSGLAAQSKNLFGIKGSGTAGSVLLPTTEFINGMPKVINAAFKKYNSFYESMVDHAKVLSNNRYAQYLKDATSINDFAEAIKKGGYATDTNYASKLLNIISSNNLHQYDTGNFSFKPLSSDTETPAPNEDMSTTENIFYYVIRAILIIGVFILMIIFFLKAFPSTSDAVNTGVDLANPITRKKAATKIVRKATGVKI